MKSGTVTGTDINGCLKRAWNSVLVSGAVAIILAIPLALIAHPISMTSAEADVREDSIRVHMRVMVEDLVLFHELKSARKQLYVADDLRRAAAEHRAFLLKYFDIRDSEGRMLNGQVSEMDASAIPAAGIAQADLMKFQVGYSLEYSTLSNENGEPFLTFTQNFGGEKALVPAIMDLTVTQRGIWLDRPVQVTAGKPHTVAFDWENPPDKPPKNWRELKRKKEMEFQRRLGITSYTGIYSYIYVTGREVRHEILVPLLTFEEWLPLPRVDPEFLEVTEQVATHDSIDAFLSQRNPVEIDGVGVEPVLQRVQFFGLDITDFARNAEPRRVGVYQARLGIILSYPVNQPPQSVKLSWDTYSKSASFLKSFIFIDEEKPLEQIFAKEQPLWKWKRASVLPAELSTEFPGVILPQPQRGTRFRPGFVAAGLLLSGIVCWLALSLACRWKRNALAAAIGTVAVVMVLPPGTKVPLQIIEETDARRIAEALLPRVYRAFDRNTEEATYDALASSVDGKLLEALYIQFRRELELVEQGGAVAHVDSVKIKYVHLETGYANADGYPAFDCLCRWHVTGTVEHWGHIHSRENAYEAVFKITGTEEGWRLAGYKIRDAQRLRSDTGLRL